MHFFLNIHKMSPVAVLTIVKAAKKSKDMNLDTNLVDLIFGLFKLS